MSSKRKRSKKEPYEQIGDFVSIYQRGDFWHVNYLEHGKQIRRSLKTTKKKQARLEAQKIETRLQSGLPPPQQDASAAEVFEVYRENFRSRPLAPKTKQKYERVLTTAEELAADIRSAQGIDFGFLDRYRAMRLKTVSESTICDELVIIQQMMKFAQQRKLITSNPLDGYEVDEPKPKPQPCWTHEEGKQIVTETPSGVYRVAFQVLLDTGMRSAELCHLQWCDVDSKNNVIHIREKFWTDGDQKLSWRPKSGDQRVVPMSQAVTAALQSLPRKSDWVFLAPASWKYPNGDHRMTSSRLLKALKRVLKKLSLEGFVHTFRHTFISHALLSGIPEATVRSWVGHVDDEIIRLYTHIADRVSQQHMRELTEGRDEDSDVEP